MPGLTIKQLNKRWMKNPAFHATYNKPNLALEIGLMVTDARIHLGMTQEKLAQKIGTKQPSIARVENGAVLPSLKFLQKIATALGTKFIPPHFERTIR